VEIQQHHTHTQNAHKPRGLFCKRAFEKKDSFAKEPTRGTSLEDACIGLEPTIFATLKERERERENEQRRKSWCV